MEELASYIAGEMNRNISHPSVLKMKELLSYDPGAAAEEFLALPWYARLAGPPNFSAIALAKQVEALAIWTERVGQDRPWDHKPIIKEMYDDVVWHKQGPYDYYFDIWSNIHYGYVGLAGGLSESLLLDGAGVEQIGSDTYRYFKEPEKYKGPRRTEGVEGMRAWDDPPDRVSIIIGMQLFKRYPKGGISPNTIMKEVLEIEITDWGTGIRDHKCN